MKAHFGNICLLSPLVSEDALALTISLGVINCHMLKMHNISLQQDDHSKISGCSQLFRNLRCLAFRFTSAPLLRLSTCVLLPYGSFPHGKGL